MFCPVDGMAPNVAQLHLIVPAIVRHGDHAVFLFGRVHNRGGTVPAGRRLCLRWTPEIDGISRLIIQHHRGRCGARTVGGIDARRGTALDHSLDG